MNLKETHPHYYALAQDFHRARQLKEQISALSLQVTVAIERGEAKKEKDLSKRAEYLEEQRLKIMTDPGLKMMIKIAVQNSDGLSRDHQENLKLMQAALFKEDAIPNDPTYNKLSNKLKETHLRNRESGNFDTIRDLFAQKVKTLRERMDQYRNAYNQQPGQLRDGEIKSRYDAMLRLKEADATEDTIEAFSNSITEKLPDVIAFLKKVQADQPAIPITRELSDDLKLAMVNEILSFVAPDELKRTMLLHSKGSSISNTVRHSFIRVKTTPTNPIPIITSGLHELGHGCYFLNIEPLEGLEEYWGQPLCDKRGGTMSEGAAYAVQQLVTSKEFWQFAGPIVRKYYNVHPGDSDYTAFSDENLHKHATTIDQEPSGNRLMSDRVSFMTHIAQRDAMERGLINGTIDPKEFDTVWDQSIKDIIGVTPKGAKDGCMQDVHFYKYREFYAFAFYATGLVFGENALQLTLRQKPDALQQVAKGNFSPILDHYKESFFRHGARYSAEQVLEMAGGKPELDIDLYINGIKNRYTWQQDNGKKLDLSEKLVI